MDVDFPGQMMDFANVPPGQFFIFFEDGRANLGMKIRQQLNPTIARIGEARRRQSAAASARDTGGG